MRIIHILTFGIVLFLLGSCDFADTKLVMENESPENLLVESIYFRDENDVKGIPCTYNEIPANNTLPLELLNRHWERIMKEGTTGVLQVNVMYKKDRDSLENHYSGKGIQNLNTYDLEDSLKSKGIYYSQTFTQQEIEQRKWTLTFPEHGFGKGKPMQLKTKPKRTPNPEVLRQKGIEDRWNKKDSTPN
ncbi:hypothetical protein [Sinomicrobium weinanense]|uniref:Lipoprotein n=1 Tax=Sinomicrobium weinanense TaxID=2842200 RepID=A0A926JPS5_9FLAO|nr:hypothetical protein [Sinomicrobium weinanense]MBC9795242.1 hypothetical protein [Sinomicrobium weinanense]MBU3122019.1 hypothetical protein [Sinomicrobium weinanense]